MPTDYKRKQTAKARGTWTSDNLIRAVDAVRNGNLGVNEAARTFQIPHATLKRRIKCNNLTKTNRLGPDSFLGTDAEEKLASHIKKLQQHGFAPTREDVRIMAYKLAVHLNLPQKFNQDQGITV